MLFMIMKINWNRSLAKVKILDYNNSNKTLPIGVQKHLILSCQ